MRYLIGIVLVLFSALIFSGCALIPTGGINSSAMVVSVSDDGSRVVSSHRDNKVFVWNIEQRSVTRLSRDGNIYSATISPDGSRLAWQGVDDVIRVESWDGEVLGRIDFEPVYGQKLANEGYIFASDIGYGIYRIDESGEYTTLKPADGRAAIGYGKLLNLSYHSGRSLLLSSGSTMRPDQSDLEEEWEKSRYRHLNGVTLWDVNAERPLSKLTGNAVKTHATLNPDGRWAVSGCENTIGLIWDVETGELSYRLGSPFHGILKEPGYTDDEKGWVSGVWDDEGLIDPPDDFDRHAVLAVKFISDRHFLRFSTYSPWVMLYELGDPLPMKYFHLGDNPLPSLHHYGRNEAIATAPETGLLVIAENRGPRLIGYQFDEDELTLTRKWVAHPRRGFRDARPVSQQY